MYGVFYQETSSDFLKDTIRCLCGCYRDAYGDCEKTFSWEVAHDARPIVRRAKFEDAWMKIGNKHGMQTSFEQNMAKNCYHLRVTKGRLILTAAFVDYRVKTVRTALYRNDYACGNQKFLFPDMDQSPAVDSPVYAILMHDVDPLHPWKPSYADIGFPDSTGKIQCRIRLAERYASVFSEDESESFKHESAASGTVSVEHIQAPGAPTLRDNFKKKDIG